MSRKSNIELLRIIAMMMVLILHANGAVGPFQPYSPGGSNLNEFFRLLVEEACLVSVNVFVMISGWFGINASWKGVLSLFFQLAFYSLLIWSGFSLFSGHLFPIKETLLSCFGMSYWFIPSYLILYALSPFLNAFIQTSSKRQYMTLLILMLMIQLIYGRFGDQGHFHGGYSALSFIILYIIAAYLHKYPFKLSSFSPALDLIIYLFLVITITVVAFFGGESMLGGSRSVLDYNNPFVIVSSVFFFLFFAKIQIQSKTINWLAVSSFAIYLIHMNFIVKPYYRSLFLKLSESIAGWSWLVFPMIIVSVGVFCMLIDKIRLFVWNKVWPVLKGVAHL